MPRPQPFRCASLKSILCFAKHASVSYRILSHCDCSSSIFSQKCSRLHKFHRRHRWRDCGRFIRNCQQSPWSYQCWLFFVPWYVELRFYLGVARKTDAIALLCATALFNHRFPQGFRLSLSHVIPKISSGILNSAHVLVFNGGLAFLSFFGCKFVSYPTILSSCWQLVGFRCWLLLISKRPSLAGTGTEISPAAPGKLSFICIPRIHSKEAHQP